MDIHGHSEQTNNFDQNAQGMITDSNKALPELGVIVILNDIQ